MIATHNQNSSRAGSRLGQFEDNNIASPNNNSNKDPTNIVGEVKENRNQEAPRSDESPKQNSTPMANTTPSGGGIEEDDDDEEEEEEDDEEEEEDGVRVGELDEEEDDEEVESSREREMSGPEVVATTTTSNGRRGTSGVGMVMQDTGMGGSELCSSGGGGGGGMGGYWNRQSRPSSPRMPPPEQPETRPRSRHEPVQPARYNNLGYWRARRVTFYKNGDPYFPGVEFRFKPGRDIGSLEALLDRLSLRLDLPRGARHIFSMDGDRKLNLDELEDGASYVVSSYKTFKIKIYTSRPHATKMNVSTGLDDFKLIKDA
ncbi:echinoderm microtubule-associated protein-like CG42247 [Leptopilina heterotoma]|uniref:echinoderm microtubule-associated protein-like CG42247 n=1 Tax=Leptopilina heterotoma TaxID=63436 RepID=UPI001CA8419C|nr:echinoderm microtubule-associated protein-like CG42247 [Leptopilina heterotoma]